MAIGPILREARQQKQLTASQVAEMTRMKVQIVDDLENDDFHRIAATIYGKGFIKLFAECVDLDPEPLIEDYLQQTGAPQPAKLPVQKEPDTAPPAPSVAAEAASAAQSEVDDAAPADDLFAYADHTKRRSRGMVAAAPASKPASPAHKPSAAPPHLETIRAGAQERFQQIRNAITQGLDRFIKKITAGGTLDKWIQRGLIALGIVVVILILIPLLRMLFAPRPPAPLPDHELILFVPPPEPYFD